MSKRSHETYIYAVRDHVLSLMADQAGKPFDYTNFRRQFPVAAARLNIYPGREPYQFCFNTVRRMVCRRLPKMLPKPPTVRELLPGVPSAWRKSGAFDIKKAQLPPGDRE